MCVYIYIYVYTILILHFHMCIYIQYSIYIIHLDELYLHHSHTGMMIGKGHHPHRSTHIMAPATAVPAEEPLTYSR